MPSNTFGYSFEPNFANANEAGKNASLVAPAGAIRTINYQLPRVAGAASVSPLVSQEQVGSPFGGAVLQSVLKTVLGPDASSYFASPSSASSTSPVSRGSSDQGSAVLSQLASPRPAAPTATPAAGPVVPQFGESSGSPQYSRPLTDWAARNPYFASKYFDADPINQTRFSGSRGNGQFVDLRSGTPDFTRAAATPASIGVNNDYSYGGLISA